MNEFYQVISKKGFNELSKKTRLLYFYMCFFSEEGFLNSADLFELIPLVECKNEDVSIFSIEEHIAALKKRLRELEQADLIGFEEKGRIVFIPDFSDFVFGESDDEVVLENIS